MIQQLNQWLANPNRNYDEGVQLYLKTRTDNKFDMFFQQVKAAPQNSLHAKMLLQKIQNIARIMGASAKAQPAHIPPVVDISKARPITVDPIGLPKRAFPRIDDNPYIRIEKLPAELQEKYEKVIKPLAKEIAHYHELAKVAPSDDDRKEAINKAA